MNLYIIPRVIVSPSGSKKFTTERTIYSLYGTSWKIQFGLRNRRYSNSPKVSFLGMNPGLGWKPDLEESYLREYSDYQATKFTQGTWGIYLQLVKFLAPDPSPILRYSECTKTISFSILGVFNLGVKLGFDFPEVLPNQKFWYWSLNFDIEEERNIMINSLKNFASVKSPNFPL